MTCRRVSSATLRLFLLVGLFYPASAAAAAGRQGKIVGDSHVNLRSGPDLSFPAVGVVRQGQAVTIEAEEKTWYRVVLANGIRGYIHKALVQQVVEPDQQREHPLPPNIYLKTDTVEPKTELSQPAPPQLTDFPGDWPNWKSIGTFLCVFGLGWVLGGNYYLRRDQRKRNKLHL